MGWELDVAHGVAIAAGWGLMYEGIRRAMRWIGKGDRSGEWSCRTVCVLHAGGAVVLSGLSNLYWGPLCYYSLGQPNTPLQTATIQISLGYFVFDLVWSLITGGETLSVLCHHILSIAVCSTGLVLGTSGAEILGTLFGAEISNPFLQARWFLVDSGFKGTPVHHAADITFALVFLFCRVFWAPTLMVAVLRSQTAHPLIQAGAVAMQLIRYFPPTIVLPACNFSKTWPRFLFHSGERVVRAGVFLCRGGLKLAVSLSDVCSQLDMVLRCGQQAQKGSRNKEEEKLVRVHACATAAEERQEKKKGRNLVRCGGCDQ